MKYWRKPLDHEKYSSPKGDISIIPDRCKGCGFCIEFCPNEVLIESDKYNVKGYHPPEVKYPDKCIACKLCELLCPEFSIYVIVHENSEKSSETNQQQTSINPEVVEDA